MVFLYLGIFISIALMVNSQNKTGSETFAQESLNIGIINKDGGVLAKKLAAYLDQYHTVLSLPDDKDVIQDKLFNRDVYYVVTIPENFEEKCLEQGEKLPVTKVPGSTTGFYVDQQINSFLNEVRVMTKGGFSLTDAANDVLSFSEIKTDVTLMDKNGHGGGVPTHALFFQFLPYVVMSILCYSLGYIRFSFNRTDVKRRMLVSKISAKSMNTQLVLGYVVFGLIIWIICLILAVSLYGRDFIKDPNIPHYLMNSFLFMLVSLAMAFFVSTVVHKDEILSAVVNVVTLGMGFTCGVFVSLELVAKSVRTVAHFLPMYWYEVNNGLLADNIALSAGQLRSLYTGYGIQLLFAVAILSVSVMIGRSRWQTES